MHARTHRFFIGGDQALEVRFGEAAAVPPEGAADYQGDDGAYQGDDGVYQGGDE